MTFYCSADGAGPMPPVDWAARQRVVSAIPDDGDGDTHTRDAAQDALNAERRAVASHIVRNGNHPRTTMLASGVVARLVRDGRLDVVLASDGTASVTGAPVGVGAVLRCPECLAPVRAVED